MKKLLFLPLLFFVISLSAQEKLQGSWQLVEQDGQPVTSEESVRIYQDDYFSFGTREAGTNKFIRVGGGEYSTNGDYSEIYDFHSEKSDLVGQEKFYDYELKNDLLKITGDNGESQTWQKISDDQNELSGNWVMTGRQRNGELNRSTPGDRRTIKILGGDRFQWVAFNSATGEFFGSGGGAYTAQDGKYTENIEFFSRDDSRVGASLGFDYEVKDGEWHHSGKSSKGDPMYEIWSPYAEAYQK